MKISSIFSRTRLTITLIIGFIGVMMFACTKYDDPAPYFEEFDSSEIPLKRKVLLISIDGMAGPEIEKIQPPFIMEMLDHSKYSWKAMTDRITTDAATWESLMTGYSVDKHQIKDSSFEVNTADDGELEDVVIPSYPTFLKRLSALRPAMKFFAASPWKALNDKALANVDDQVTAGNDLEVKDSIVSQLKNGHFDLLIANFNEVNIAGKEGAFSAENSTYKNAVLKVDDYVKELVEAIKTRSDYKEEQWLVILTSNHGGKGNAYGGITVKEREILTAYYNPHFESYEIPGYDYDMGVELHSNAATIADENAYNVGASGEFTVSLRIKASNFGSNNPAFLSKSTQSYGAGNHQWTMMFQGGSGNWRTYMVSTGGSQVYLAGGSLTKNEWHTLTFKVAEEDGKRIASVYSDGVFKNSSDITGKDFTNDKVLRLGNTSGYGGGTSTETIQDIRIWDTAIPDSVIDKLACDKEADVSDFDNNLIGFWPGNGGVGDAFIDQSPSGNDFEFNNNTWDLISAFNGCKVDDGTSSKSDIEQITNFDIPVQIFYWLRVNVSPDWDWSGNRFLDRFEKEFYQKRNED